MNQKLSSLIGTRLFRFLKYANVQFESFREGHSVPPFPYYLNTTLWLELLQRLMSMQRMSENNSFNGERSTDAYVKS